MAATQDDETAIRGLIEAWAAAVRRRDHDGVLARHAPDMLMFDVPGPFQSQGIEAYRKTWDVFFGWMSGPPKFEFSNIRITAGADVAFVTAHGHCYGPDDHGKPADLDFRLTMGLRKIDGQWIVEHEHHSIPAA
ncbi:MAG TPA: SgcJ/EcaC family oxidoreductase [Alphaproteobacteria bacterium]|jgi:uncharacterized protein (TIGR02246 family)|nr:SgcJ/EcaC family oxidoreductase [Alphaproteobacteria bacterium]